MTPAGTSCQKYIAPMPPVFRPRWERPKSGPMQVMAQAPMESTPQARGTSQIMYCFLVLGFLMTVSSVAVSLYVLGRISSVEDVVGDGITSATEPKGADGADGTDGTDGTNGMNGLNGTDGLDGAGITFANLLRVDGSLGNDTTGAPGGVHVYKTISGAIADASYGQVVFVAPGRYEETLVLPSGIVVVGMATELVVVSQTNVSAATTLVTLNPYSAIQRLTLEMTSVLPAEMIGVSLAGAASSTASITSVDIMMNNTMGGIANTVGIYSQGTGNPHFGHNDAVNIIIRIFGDGGATRGILVDTNAHAFTARDVDIFVNGSGTAIAAEVNVAGGSLSLGRCSLFGATADVSRTQGTLTLSGSKLETPNANGLSFSPVASPSLLTFGDPGSLPSGTRYLYPGVQGASSNEVFVAMQGPAVAISLSVRFRTAGVAGRIDTFTVRKNGVDTPLALSITGPALTASTTVLSADFNAGDSLSLKVDGGAGSNPADTLVVVGLY